MPLPKRTRNKNGRFRKKRSDTGKPRGPSKKKSQSKGTLPDNGMGQEREDHIIEKVAQLEEKKMIKKIDYDDAVRYTQRGGKKRIKQDSVNYTLRKGRRVVFKSKSAKSVMFPKGEPEYWYAEYGVEEDRLIVRLGDFIIKIPREKVESWFDIRKKGRCTE